VRIDLVPGGPDERGSGAAEPVPTGADTREWTIARKLTVTAGATLTTIVGPSLDAEEMWRTIDWRESEHEKRLAAERKAAQTEIATRASHEALVQTTEELRAAESSLVAERTRSEKAEKERDDWKHKAEARGEEKDRHRREKLAAEARSRELEDALRGVEPFLGHRGGCAAYQPTRGGPRRDCDCGLVDLRSLVAALCGGDSEQ
jgi:ribosomal protein L14E/L6E/L27E